ncbi:MULTISPECIES: methyl-accepting chemotaxis protein [Zoogloea]|jgi:methyl-accepting chemotaxis protein|uniref:Methyl-accepting chemotaxis protein n=1 Tax=Zoogloea oleivorans TaxID=1552750 RepID=A0A6C2D4N7_9RHOO|nr:MULTISPECIES: methyl-accepting chemotaxis protein [Zoogloea]MBP8132915.1 methyl-accepting chemotaxis protein [Zoogloea sp.]MBT9498731.1 methyl-accepting chemotaxis protein [Zoogloea sp.]MDD2670638.1 methyl-accepting chemotaxis protein [Zoogloea sp.]MDY0036674.1 methyl-accepting chemotaxis protein [Zoogloea oleivorans]TYC61267.1 methyl-accepting chemotaxis protein [Zoogloea oleivorans]
MKLENLRVSTRMRLLVALALLGLVALCAVSLANLRSSLMDDRKLQTKYLVESAQGVIEHFYKQSQAGTLAEADARKGATETLRAMRYAGNNYLFVVDNKSTYVLLPPKPEKEGTDASGLKDSNGKVIIQELVKAALAGGGFVDYLYPKAGETDPQPKLSYAAPFAPWGWVLGTGIYVDDVDREFRSIATILGGISATLLLVLGLFGWRVSASVTSQLGGEPREATAVMQRAAGGDLTTHLGNAPNGSMLAALGSMIGALRTMMGEINSGANQLVSNADHISRVSSQVADAALRQSDATASMAAAMEELTVSSSHISASALETEQNSQEAMRLAAEGSDRVGQASTAIRRMSETVTGASSRILALEERIGQVSSIANVIKEIAGQTNLLALNAAIEAARAGEQGRGFAVVADEVRKLAERTSSATTEIEQMITGIQSDTSSAVGAMNAALPEVDQGVTLAASAAEALQAIESGARQTLVRVREIADATREQSAASTSIAQRVEEISNMVESTSENIRGAADAAIGLERIAVGLKDQISRFRI